VYAPLHIKGSFTTKNSVHLFSLEPPCSLHVCQFSLGLPCHSRPPTFCLVAIFKVESTELKLELNWSTTIGPKSLKMAHEPRGVCFKL